MGLRSAAPTTPTHSEALATLTILVFVTQIAASLLLQGAADNSERVAAFLAGLVLSPVLFLGAALLYVDQAARLRTRAER